MSKIVFSQVSWRTEGVQKLKDFSLSVEEGEFLSLLGPAGSGKTAVLRLLSGLDMPSAGAIWLDGQKVADAADGTFVDPFLRNIGMTFALGTLWPHMTAWQNVAFGLQARGFSKSEIRQRVDLALESLGVAQVGNRLPKELTTTEQQRVALARAVVGGARTILIDALLSEPDRSQRVAIRGDIKRLHKSTGVTVLLATRDDEEALTVSTRIAMIDSGSVSHVDDPVTLYLNPNSLEIAQRIGFPAINLIPAKGQIEDDLITVQSVLGIYQFTREFFTPQTKPERLFDCYIGVRPELVNILKGQAQDMVEAAVYSCQLAGSETIVQLHIGEQPLLAKCLGLHLYQADQRVYTKVDPACVNLFHAKTGELIKKAFCSV